MSVSKGIQTTEFALTVVVNIAGIVGSLSGVIPASLALLIMAGINAVYGVMRAIVKVNDPSYQAPELPAKA